MASNTREREHGSRFHLTDNWPRIGGFLVLFVSLALFAAICAAKLRHLSLASNFLAAVLLTLAFTSVLFGLLLILLRRDVYKTAMALASTGRGFKSIFQNAPDAILILDDQGICLQANPAAFRILGVSPERLLGHSLGDFYPARGRFSETWTRFLDQKYQRADIELVRGDGQPVFVDCTVTNSYAPGQHLVILCDITQRVNAERALRESQERLELMTSNIQEIVWMLKPDTKELVSVTDAYEAVTGHTLQEIRENPSSYKELVHPEDRARFLAKLEEASVTGKFDEEFRIVRPDGTTRWIWSKSSPIWNSPGELRWLVGVARDITARKNAEAEVAKHLAAAEAARAEAEALRKATLTLTQNLRMDALLDTLLQTLRTIVPYESACVLLPDTDHSFLVARQMPRETSRKSVVTLEVADFHFLQKVLFTRDGVLVENTANESEWRDSPAFGCARSWIGIPLVASEHLLGLLSLSSTEPGRFVREHLRLAKSLAFAAAVAIQNARLYERAEIYAAELELQLKRLKETQAALEQTQGRSRRADG